MAFVDENYSCDRKPRLTLTVKTKAFLKTFPCFSHMSDSCCFLYTDTQQLSHKVKVVSSLSCIPSYKALPFKGRADHHRLFLVFSAMSSLTQGDGNCCKPDARKQNTSAMKSFSEMEILFPSFSFSSLSASTSACVFTAVTASQPASPGSLSAFYDCFPSLNVSQQPGCLCLWNETPHTMSRLTLRVSTLSTSPRFILL